MIIDLILIGILSLALILQIAITLGVFGTFAFAKKKEEQLEKEDEPISIVIAAHNELSNLKKLLPRLDAQDYPLFEVIVVDDRSVDETYDFLLKEIETYDAFRLIRINDLPVGVHPKKYALSLGIKAAEYGKVLLTDADCLPRGPQWVRAMVNAYDEGTEFVLGYCPQRKHPGLLNMLIRFETFLTGVQYLSMQHIGWPYMGVGRNLSYTRDIFVRNRGFGIHSSVTGGDDDLFVNAYATRANTRAAYSKNAQTITEPKRSWLDYWRQKTRHLSVSRYYREKDKIVLGIFNISMILVTICSIILLFRPTFWLIGIASLAVRWMALMVVLPKIGKKLHDPIAVWAIPLMDILNQLVLVAASINGYTSRRIRWK